MSGYDLGFYGKLRKIIHKYFLLPFLSEALYLSLFRVTGGELFEDIVAREFYSEADAR